MRGDKAVDICILRDNLLRFQIPLLLRKDAAAVFLDIHFQFPCPFLTGAEIGPEIPVKEFHAIFMGCPLCHFPHQLMILVGADEEGGGEGIEAAFCRLTGGIEKTHLVAFDTARQAAEGGFDNFTSSLFISPYQNHELMREVAERAAHEYGVEFLYRDFRPYFRPGQERARELEMYIQKYCGCVFSEQERYLKPKKIIP